MPPRKLTPQRPAEKPKAASQPRASGSSSRRPQPSASQDNSKSSSSRTVESSSSQLSGTGLGIGLGVSLNESLSRASFKVKIEEEGDEEIEDKEQSTSSKPSTNDEEKPLTSAQVAKNARRVDSAQADRDAMTASALSAFGIQLDLDAFKDSPTSSPTKAFSLIKSTRAPRPKKPAKIVKKRLDFFSSLANMPELLMELAKHLRIADLLTLYCISRDFHETINGHLSHCMRACAAYMAPDSSKLFLFKFYGPLLISDPSGRAHPSKPSEIRKVPGLRWLSMVVHREKTVRDILACMARQGHRMKPGMALTLKKMWLIMDISTTAGRVQMMHNRRMFTDVDLYNIQFFVVKLDMRFNDPIDGPGTEDLRKLFFGQRTLTPLCQLLKREKFLDTLEIVKLAVRYSYRVRPEHRGYPIFDIPPEEVGIGHLEGWGKGKLHLMRPDELCMVESVRRRLGLKNYLLEMMTWGYIDPITGKDIPVTDEEKYMSEDEDMKKGKRKGKGKGKGRGREAGWSDYFEPNGSASEGSDEGEDDKEWEDDDGDDDDDGEDDLGDGPV